MWTRRKLTEKMEPPEGSEERRSAEESVDPGDPEESDTSESVYVSVDLTEPEDAGETKDSDEQAAVDESDEQGEAGTDGPDESDEAGTGGSYEPGEADETADLTDTGDAAGSKGAEEAAGVKDAGDTVNAKNAGRDAARTGRPAQPRKRNRKNRRRKRMLKVLLVLAILAAFFAVMNLPYFEVQHIPVIGNKTVSDKKIRKLSEVKKGDKIFLLNPWLIESRIKTNLYIEDVKVKRDLPGTVELIVKEREPAAQIIILSREGQRSYVTLDRDGMVMEIKKKKKHVTMVHNVVALKAEPGSQVKVDDTGTYHKAMELIRTAQAGDLYFKRIDITGSQVRAYIYDDLVCKGRYRNIIDSISNGTLKSVVYRLYQDGVEEGVINIGDNNYCSFTPQN